MSQQFRDTDDAIERVLRWRADRARPIGLLDAIQEKIEVEPRHRAFAWFGLTSPRLVWLLLLFALLAVVAGGAAMSGARLLSFSSVTESPPPSHTTSQVDASALNIVYCDKPRSLPFGATGTPVTGTWSDQDLLFYFRQVGSTVWGEGWLHLGRLESLSSNLNRYRSTVFHGTVASDGTVHLDWSDVGAVNPADVASSQSPFETGTIVLRIRAAADGNAEMVSMSQSGGQLLGPAFSSSLVFTPCAPAYQPQ